MDNILKGLNPGQLQAVQHKDGALMILAGAGSGKTTVMTRRAAWLIREGVPPEAILTVTFTNKAAGELRQRLRRMVGPEAANRVTAATFHAFALRQILRPYAKPVLGLSRLVVLDDDDATALLKESLKELAESDRQQIRQEGWKPADFKDEIGRARAWGYSPASYRKGIRPGNSREIFEQLTVRVWELYEKRCRANNGVDFDDILVLSAEILRRSPSARGRLQRRFGYVMVDEFQDTNPVQAEMIDALVESHGNIGVVGDFRQSIYKFRGANINVILDFQKRYPSARVVDLAVNYRSTGPIVEAANRLAGAMQERMDSADMEAGSPHRALSARPVLNCYPNDRMEADAITVQVRALQDEGHALQDMAVLYRNRGVKQELERAFLNARIPYVVVGDTGFFGRREIRDALAMLRFAVNPDDSLAGLRLLDAVKIGVSAAKVREEMHANDQGAWQVLDGRAKKGGKIGERVDALLADLESLGLALRNNSAAADNLWVMWETHLQEATRKACKDREGQGEQDKAFERRRGYVEQLFTHIQQQVEEGRDILEVLEDLALLAMDRIEEGQQTDAVQFMTIHAAKGLEFDSVFLPALEDGICPGQAENAEEVEEERRVLYVALTRARKHLYLSHADFRLLYGQTNRMSPSPFLREIREALSVPAEETGVARGAAAIPRAIAPAYDFADSLVL